MTDNEVHRFMFFIMIIVILFFGFVYHSTTKPYLTNTQVFTILFFGLALWVIAAVIGDIQINIAKSVSGDNKELGIFVYIVLGLVLIYLFRKVVRPMYQSLIQ